MQKADKALATLSAAVANDPKNPLCKFHRASIFFAAGRYAEALKELEELKEIVPKESLVYYLTGKVFASKLHTCIHQIDVMYTLKKGLCIYFLIFFRFIRN